MDGKKLTLPEKQLYTSKCDRNSGAIHSVHPKFRYSFTSAIAGRRDLHLISQYMPQVNEAET